MLSTDVQNKIQELLVQMTLEEKIGQLWLIPAEGGAISTSLKEAVVSGQVGGIFNEVDSSTIIELQKLAINESVNKIPLLMGRDIIHGFKTIFPVPIGLASTWNPDLVKMCGKISAMEASHVGLNWTFSPMVDVTRDPRWGRVAESFGEDPYLCSVFAKAMVLGLQGNDLSESGKIGACVKHFAGYGASEGGKDYNTTNIPENELRNVHLPPFKAAIDAGVISVMTSFSDLNGIPASANQFLLTTILRKEWGFTGFIVSDWESIKQLKVHGFTETDKDSAFEAANAGADMEMTSSTLKDNLSMLIEENKISMHRLDSMVTNVLTAKYKLGLFESDILDKKVSVHNSENFLEKAKQSAVESCILLKNKNNILPLTKEKLSSVIVIGPLADEPAEQLGTWVFDGDSSMSITPLKSLKKLLGEKITINFHQTLESSISKSKREFDNAVNAAKDSDIVLMFMGEDSLLSGEAHCRSDIKLPGVQEDLIHEMYLTGKPIILVLMAGRPLVLTNIIDKVDAILCAWHPGTMAGPAITDLLFGIEVPSGKLPISFPKSVGQIPVYYAHKNTGRPGTKDSIVHIDHIQKGVPQHSFGNTSFYLDTSNGPLFEFGYGLSYTSFEYKNLKLSNEVFKIGESITVEIDVTNTGDVDAYETVQLYIRDLVGSVTRPVKELKKFTKTHIKSKETKRITFELSTDDLVFYGRTNQLVVEPGKFYLWVGGSSKAELKAEFDIF